MGMNKNNEQNNIKLEQKNNTLLARSIARSILKIMGMNKINKHNNIKLEQKNNNIINKN